MHPAQPSGDIEIRLRSLSQLLQTLDPSPFRDSSLAPDADEYLLGRAKEVPKKQPIRLVIQLPAEEMARQSQTDVAAIITNHFAFQAQAESRKIQELFHSGRRAVLIGFVTLSVCLFFAWHVAHNLPGRPATRILQESFTILGWVSVWRPVEIFLYDWIPFARRRNLFRRLAAAQVLVRQE